MLVFKTVSSGVLAEVLVSLKVCMSNPALALPRKYKHFSELASWQHYMQSAWNATDWQKKPFPVAHITFNQLWLFLFVDHKINCTTSPKHNLKQKVWDQRTQLPSWNQTESCKLCLSSSLGLCKNQCATGINWYPWKLKHSKNKNVGFQENPKSLSSKNHKMSALHEHKGPAYATASPSWWISSPFPVMKYTQTGPIVTEWGTFVKAHLKCTIAKMAC